MLKECKYNCIMTDRETYSDGFALFLFVVINNEDHVFQHRVVFFRAMHCFNEIFFSQVFENNNEHTFIIYSRIFNNWNSWIEQIDELRSCYTFVCMYWLVRNLTIIEWSWKRKIDSNSFVFELVFLHLQSNGKNNRHSILKIEGSRCSLIYVENFLGDKSLSDVYTMQVWLERKHFLQHLQCVWSFKWQGSIDELFNYITLVTTRPSQYYW
jgi:hypothetical protein